MKLYPLKFIPIYKERLWGGTKLNTLLKKDIQSATTGESWEVSTVKGDVSVVANGALKGKSLQHLVDVYEEKLLGKRIFNRFGNEFPILIKFIDAQKDLSIQLHPDDELAKKRHQSFGKTEMWYVMQADTDAKLIVGFNNTINPTTYEQHLKHNTLPEILNYETVNEGDAFFIRPGKIHAIGSGILLAEIQQTSDVTYRIFDFNRKDKNGNLRELHTDLALEAIDYTKKEDFKLPYNKSINTPENIAHCPYFITNYLKIEDSFIHSFSGRDCFSIYICVDGVVDIVTDDIKESLKKGETLLIPAEIDEIQIHSVKATLLEVYL